MQEHGPPSFLEGRCPQRLFVEIWSRFSLTEALGDKRPPLNALCHILIMKWTEYRRPSQGGRRKRRRHGS